MLSLHTALLTTSLLLLLHLLLLPHLCRNLPYCSYHQPPSTPPSATSLEEAVEEELRQIARSGSPEGGGSWVAVVVLTRSRRGASYLGRSLAALHRQVVGEEEQPRVLLCSGEPGERVGSTWPFLTLRPNTTSTQPPGNRRAKEDLASCVALADQALAPEVTHVLVLEDDVEVMEGLFPTLAAWMTYHRGTLAAPWLDIKLYASPRLRGWAWDPAPLVELLATSALLAGLVEGLVVVGGRTTIRRARVVVVWAGCLAALLVAGRQHVVQWRRLHPQLYLRKEAPSAGTQAVLYPRTALASAAAFLLERVEEDTPRDLTLGQYRRAARLAGHLLEPNLARHIGRTSAFDAAHAAERDQGDTREFLADGPL